MAHSDSDLTNQLAEISDRLEKLDGKLHRKTSVPYVFGFSVLSGIGSAIGATLIAGLVLALMARTFQTVGVLPRLERWAESRAIQFAPPADSSDTSTPESTR